MSRPKLDGEVVLIGLRFCEFEVMQEIVKPLPKKETGRAKTKNIA